MGRRLAIRRASERTNEPVVWSAAWLPARLPGERTGVALVKLDYYCFPPAMYLHLPRVKLADEPFCSSSCGPRRVRLWAAWLRAAATATAAHDLDALIPRTRAGAAATSPAGLDVICWRNDGRSRLAESLFPGGSCF
jgi:hypothetical protein